MYLCISYCCSWLCSNSFDSLATSWSISSESFWSLIELLLWFLKSRRICYVCICYLMLYCITIFGISLSFIIVVNSNFGTPFFSMSCCRSWERFITLGLVNLCCSCSIWFYEDFLFWSLFRSSICCLRLSSCICSLLFSKSRISYSCLICSSCCCSISS